MFPAFLPPSVHELTEPTSIEMARQVCQATIKTDLSDRPIATTYVRQGADQSQPPVLLIHGFDSSLLEFRRLLPLLGPVRDTWAIDLLGFGFTDRTCTPAITPAAIKHHLYSFWQQQVRQPMVIVGASMGGAAAIDLAVTHPEVVQRLILIDSAGLAAGPAMGKFMVSPLDRWATIFLRNSWVRRRISLQAYQDKGFVTLDAEVCASLHLQCPHWSEALIAFTKSGGYNFLQDKIAKISMPTLILWGRQDKILGTRDATLFVDQIPDAELVWVDNCGHVPHLEQANAVAAALQRWL